MYLGWPTSFLYGAAAIVLSPFIRGSLAGLVRDSSSAWTSFFCYFLDFFFFGGRTTMSFATSSRSESRPGVIWFSLSSWSRWSVMLTYAETSGTLCLTSGGVSYPGMS